MNDPRLPRYRSGDALKARGLNRRNRTFEALGNFTVGPGFHYYDGPGGRHLALAITRPIPAILSGTASPYSWSESTRSPGGPWVAMIGGRSGTANAVELNALPNLGGKFAWLRPCGLTAAGDVEYCFQHVRRGAPCTGTIAVTVLGCGNASANALVAGVTVTVTDPANAVVGTGTTDANGTFSVPITKAQTYTITLSKTRFATQTDTLAATCTTNTVSYTLQPASGYICCGTCADPIPTTLHLTDSAGSVPLVWDGTQYWSGMINHQHQGLVIDSYGNCSQQTITIPLTYYLSCPNAAVGNPYWTLRQFFYYYLPKGATQALCLCPNLVSWQDPSFCASSVATGVPPSGGNINCYAQSIFGAPGTPGPGNFTDAGVNDTTHNVSPSCIPVNLSFDFSVSNHCHVIEAGTVTITE